METEVINLSFKTPSRFELDNNNLFDEVDFTSPAGSRSFIQHEVITEEIRIFNPNRERLTFRLEMNDNNFSNDDGFLTKFKKYVGKKELTMALFNFFCDHFYHGSSRFFENNTFVWMMNFWGCGFCGESAFSFLSLLIQQEIPFRLVQYNGHSVFEYFIEGKWQIFDTDLNVFYLAWDNQTIIGYDELKNDPLLAYRTKPYGKYNDRNFQQRIINVSLLNLKDKSLPEKEIDKKKSGEIRSFDLNSKEMIVFSMIENPDCILKSHTVKTESLFVIKQKLNLDIRKIKGETVFYFPYPIYKITDLSGTELFRAKSDELRFSCLLYDFIETQIMVYGYASRVIQPYFRKGKNVVGVFSDKEMILDMEIQLKNTNQKSLTIPKIYSDLIFRNMRVSFKLETNEAEKIWYQISDQQDFCVVPPSLNTIQSQTDSIEIDLIDETFINPEQTYFLRYKVFSGNLWSNWSEPVEFMQMKEIQPNPIIIRMDKGEYDLKIEKKFSDSVLYIFGSNRKDFKPEIYSDIECTGYKGFNRMNFQSNKNFICLTEANRIKICPEKPYMRIIFKSGDCYSIPSNLIVFEELLDQAEVLQSKVINQDYFGEVTGL